jgi:hypothetical protein
VREELRHRSDRNLPESAAANKLRPFAFPKKQTAKLDCRLSRPGRGRRTQKGASTSYSCNSARSAARPRSVSVNRPSPSRTIRPFTIKAVTVSSAMPALCPSVPLATQKKQNALSNQEAPRDGFWGRHLRHQTSRPFGVAYGVAALHVEYRIARRTTLVASGDLLKKIIGLYRSRLRARSFSKAAGSSLRCDQRWRSNIGYCPDISVRPARTTGTVGFRHLAFLDQLFAPILARPLWINRTEAASSCAS